MNKIILSGLFFIILVQPAMAWGECPFGEINDSAPGLCGRYLDTDRDNICDYSQPAPDARESTDTINNNTNQTLPHISGKVLKTKTIAEVAEFYSISQEAYRQALASYLSTDIVSNDSLQELHDNYGFPASEAREIANNIFLTDSKVDPINITDISSKSSSESAKTIIYRYKLFSIIIILIFLYLFTYSLSVYKFISVVAHRKLWNFALIISFLVSALLGLLLVIRINYGWAPNFPFNMLYWHVEAGIVMATISVFHITWHWQYFKNIVKKKK